MALCPTPSSRDWWNDWRRGEHGLGCECGSTHGEQLPDCSRVSGVEPCRWGAGLLVHGTVTGVGGSRFGGT